MQTEAGRFARGKDDLACGYSHPYSRAWGDSAIGREQHAAIERQLDDPLLPDPVDLPTWETCVAGVVDTYASIVR